MFTMSYIEAILAQLPDNIKTLWLAYSGGVDSHVLLHILAMQSPHKIRHKIQVVHINHGLNSKSQSWDQHCADVCHQLKLPYQSISIGVHHKAGESLEAVARHARYQALASMMHSDDCVLTAHHQNDQAETLLLQLLRGAGVKGCSAMPLIAPFAKGYLYRPLLNFNREQLRQYAQQQGLQWIEDESNDDTRFDRNFIRHKIMPTIVKRYPGALKSLSRSTKHFAEADQLLTELAEQDYKNCLGSVKNTLSIGALLKLNLARQRLLLRYWLEALSFVIPHTRKLAHIQQDVLYSRVDAMPLITWSGVEVRRYRDNLYAMAPLCPHKQRKTLAWDLTKALRLPNNLGILQAQASLGQGLKTPSSTLEVRFRHGGERFHPAGRVQSQTLKKLLQDWSVPPWQRDRIPLLYYDQHLICVVGYNIHKDFIAQSNQKSWQVRLC
ncbi:MAG: tRNA lysidine(34) synthetase TilS [Gammaproteobacteria bacterium]